MKLPLQRSTSQQLLTGTHAARGEPPCDEKRMMPAPAHNRHRQASAERPRQGRPETPGGRCVRGPRVGFWWPPRSQCATSSGGSALTAGNRRARARFGRVVRGSGHGRRSGARV